MKILLISNYLPDRQESMLRYARMLESELRLRGHDAVAVYPKAFLLRLFGESVRLAKWLGYVDKYLLAPAALRRACRGADVVHVCDHSNSMYLPLAGKTPSLITCHDLLAVFAAQGRYAGVSIGGTGRLLQRWIARGLSRARQVICVSHKSAEDLRELAGGSPPPTTVVHNPLNWDFHPVPQEETAQLLAARGIADSRPYLFHVGSNSWYKNRSAAVRIFAGLKRSAQFAQTRLILAGKPWSASLRETVQASGEAPNILEFGEVSNEELRALYSGAQAFLFPSRHEGFGWPILEAQACGCPVITTARAPMTEVAGSAAILIDPDEPATAAESILSQLDRLPALRDEGLANAARFSMDRAIEGYLAAYRGAIAQQGAR